GWWFFGVGLLGLGEGRGAGWFLVSLWVRAGLVAGGVPCSGGGGVSCMGRRRKEKGTSRGCGDCGGSGRCGDGSGGSGGRGGGSVMVGDGGRRGDGRDGGMVASVSDGGAGGGCGGPVRRGFGGLQAAAVPPVVMGSAPDEVAGSSASGLVPSSPPKLGSCDVAVALAFGDGSAEAPNDNDVVLDRMLPGSCMNMESGRRCREGFDLQRTPGLDMHGFGIVGEDVQMAPSASLNGDGPSAGLIGHGPSCCGSGGAHGLGQTLGCDLGSSADSGGMVKDGMPRPVMPLAVTFVEALRGGSVSLGRDGGSGGLDGGPIGQGHGRSSTGGRSDRGHVLIPESVVEVGARSFATTLVGLILGHCPPFVVVERFAMRLWASYGIRRVRAFGPGQLLLEFDSAERFSTLLERSPWTIAGRPVLLRHWTPEMSFEDLQPRTLPVWVKFSGMPTSLYTEVGLDLIASSFGKPILMDQVTRSGTRLRFARILVELDASMPIEREMTFELPSGATFTVSAEFAFMPPQCCE
ncbi:hypothetical protein Dimus_033835, partial [Dionaea muscipula]